LGFLTIWLTWKPSPVSRPLTITPVLNGPFMQPTELRRSLLSGAGLGKA
jgi:hypothetical protein